MKYVNWGNTGLKVPAVVLGCMRLTSLDEKQATDYIAKVMEDGANFFDHADIYGGGKCEELFAKAVRNAGIKREDIFVQTKCGIRSGMFDFSKEYIVESVDKALQRLGMDYVDALLLHRPDALVEPEEVAEAFDKLEAAGKVRYFGVSNHKPMQIELLKKAVKQPIVANQMQLSAAHATMISNGLEANMLTDRAVDRDGGVLDYCRLKDITIQAWSPFQHGMFRGPFLTSDQFPELNGKLKEIGDQYGVTPTTIATAWLLRHPAGIQVLAGTMTPSRWEEIVKACDITLTRQEWYSIFLAAGNILP